MVEGSHEEELPYPDILTEWEDGEESGSEREPNGQPEDRPRKYYIEEGEVSIVAELVQVLDGQGKMRTVQFTKYAREQITTLYPSVEALKSTWEDLEQRKSVFEQLEDHGIDMNHLIEITKMKEADPFDLLCFVAYDLKPLTRKQRAELLKKNKPDLFSEYFETAQEVLNMILDKYIKFGPNQLRPDIIQVSPMQERGMWWK